MSKNLPHYRNDDTNISPKLRNFLDETFLKNVENIHRHNPKILVVFSGGNALGKSTISQKIEKELHGIVLENDVIKTCLKQHFTEMNRDELNANTWRYSMDLYERLGTLMQNGLVVRDGIIDWYFERIMPIFERQGYELFVIAFDVSRPKRIELIRKRGDKPTVSAERLIPLIDEHDFHAERFRKAYPPDITLTDDDLFDHDKVIRLLRRRLTTAGDRKPLQ